MTVTAMPALQSSQELTSAVRRPVPRRAGWAKRHGSILLIEDEVDLNRVLAARLRRADFRVHQSFDGLDGLGQVVTERPDVILLDLRLPTMGGFQLLHRLRMVPEIGNTPTLIMTGDPDPLVEEKAELMGIREVLRKPFSNKVLLRAIRRILE